MSSEQLNNIRTTIKASLLRLQPFKPLMHEDELEDVEYYESFDITNSTNKNMCLSILNRLTKIETRLLKKNTSNLNQ